MHDLDRQSVPGFDPITSDRLSATAAPFLGDLMDSSLQGEEVPNEIVIIDQSSAPHPAMVHRRAHRHCDIR